MKKEKLEMGKNLVYLTVPDFFRLACGFVVRQGNVCAQLGQGAPLAMFKDALLQAEKLLGKRRASIRFDSFICRKCEERFATISLTTRGDGHPRIFCDECAPPKRQATGRRARKGGEHGSQG